MVTKNVNQKYICLTTLKSRGWTPKLINEFAPVPILCENRNYKYSSPVKLFSISEIEQIEQEEDFKLAFEKSKKRKVSSKKAVETKCQRNLAALQEHLKSIEVEVIPLTEVKSNALDSRYEWYLERHKSCVWAYHNVPGVKEYVGEWADYDDYDFEEQVAEAVVSNASEQDIVRWMVNYIRHNLTSYDDFMAEILGKTGVADLYEEVNKAVYKEIAQAYPSLKEECNRQLLHKGFDELEESCDNCDAEEEA